MKSLIKLCLGAAVAVSLSTAAVAGPFNETDQCSSCAMVIKKYPGNNFLNKSRHQFIFFFYSFSCMTQASWIGKIPTTQS